MPNSQQYNCIGEEDQRLTCFSRVAMLVECLLSLFAWSCLSAARASTATVRSDSRPAIVSVSKQNDFSGTLNMMKTAASPKIVD